ncbi:MAG: protein translocase subunit SecDF [Bacteroidia bacterium]
MQSKGAIKLLAILFAIVCIYQLSFTFVSRSAEKTALEKTGGDPKKYQNYLDSLQTVGIYNLGVKDYTYQECKEREINLGLDLKGGMNVTLEVSVIDLVRSMANNSTDPTFTKALEQALVMEKNSQEDFVTLFGRAFEKIDPNAKLAAVFNTIDLADRINYNSTNSDVLKVIKSEADAAISRTFNILRTRIDKFGVSQPNIQQLGSGRILVELPGVKEPERVRKLLQGTAKLEFWETYDNAEVFNYLSLVNDYLKESNRGSNDSTGTDDSIATADAVRVKRDSSGTLDTTALAKLQVQDCTAVATTKPSMLEKIEKGDSTGAEKDTSAEGQMAKFTKENPLFAILSPAIFQNANNQSEYRKGPVVGYALIKDTSKINTILAMAKVKSILPKELKLLWDVKPPTKESKALELVAIKVTSRDGRAPLDGAAISDARQDFGQFGGKPEISMNMNPEGAQAWKRLTGENVGKSVAIVLDDYVYSFPTVQGEIAGGHSNITGNFGINEAKDLANILKAGKLPAPARIVEEAVVGPSLGQEAINSGLLSFIIALILVLVFMVCYYNNAGLVADVALFANVFFIMGVLASLGAVLTLPGIAGIVLTIGMSVDANILIFERIREEMALGKGIRLAISDGFKHAFSSIIDSNITTLILGIILYIFGNGPIQGFATTLIIGILSSLFCAIFITRLIFEWQLGRNQEPKFWNSVTKGAFKNIHINFVGNRKIYYIISSIIIIAGVAAVASKGLNFGVDFEGGRTFVVRFDKPVTTIQVIDALKVPFSKAPEVKTFGGKNQVKITTSYLIEDTGSDAEQKVKDKLNEGLKTIGANNYEVMSSQKVGPTIADDIKTSSVWAILISCALMFIYIFIRFRRWQYGLGAVVALFHDALVVLALFTIFNGILPFSLEIDQAFIAAILTVMGYSMTDTVVVFDRIREFVGVHHHATDEKKVINDALNATLSRTINTSLTIFFVLLAIFIFGGEVIRGFTFALLIGIVIGTYSSICIATPIVIDFASKKQKVLHK